MPVNPVLSPLISVMSLFLLVLISSLNLALDFNRSENKVFTAAASSFTNLFSAFILSCAKSCWLISMVQTNSFLQDYATKAAGRTGRVNVGVWRKGGKYQGGVGGGVHQ